MTAVFEIVICDPALLPRLADALAEAGYIVGNRQDEALSVLATEATSETEATKKILLFIHRWRPAGVAISVQPVRAP